MSVVGGEDADAVGWVAQQTHVHVQSHRVLRLAQILHRDREDKSKINAFEMYKYREKESDLVLGKSVSKLEYKSIIKTFLNTQQCSW